MVDVGQIARRKICARRPARRDWRHESALRSRIGNLKVVTVNRHGLHFAAVAAFNDPAQQPRVDGRIESIPKGSPIEGIGFGEGVEDLLARSLLKGPARIRRVRGDNIYMNELVKLVIVRDTGYPVQHVDP